MQLFTGTCLQVPLMIRNQIRNGFDRHTLACAHIEHLAIALQPRLGSQKQSRHPIAHVHKVARLSLPRFQGQCLESCFYTVPMKTNDHNECPVYATSLQR